MSQISQNFKTKAKRGLSCAMPATKMAGGGIISQLVDGAKGAFASITAPATTIARPNIPPAGNPSPDILPDGGMLGQATQSIRGRHQTIDDAERAATGYEVGGVIGPDGLSDAQRAKKNAALGNLGMSTGPAPAAQAPAPAPQALAPAPQQAPSLGGTINSIRERQRVLSSLATGGIVGAKTYEFEGKGTGTSDDIPVKVAGNQINVSDGEKAVVLPAKTAQNSQALDAIETIIQQSNNGRPVNRGLRDGMNANNGVIEGPMPLLDDEVRARSAANLAARGRTPSPTAMPSAPAPTAQPSAPAPMAQPLELPASQQGAAEPGRLRRGINWGADKLGFTSKAAAPTMNTGPAPATAPAPTPRPTSIAQYTPQIAKEVIKERVPQALQTATGAGKELLKNLNTAANTTVAAGDAIAAGNSNEDGGWGQVRDTAMAIPRVMAGAAGADVDLGKVRNGIRGLEAAGNATSGFLADRLPTGWVTGLAGGAANASTGFRPMTRAIQAINGESPLQEMYREDYNTSKEQMPGVFETAANGIAAVSSDGQTSVMRNKNRAPDGAGAAPRDFDKEVAAASFGPPPQAYPMSVPGGPVAPEVAPAVQRPQGALALGDKQLSRGIQDRSLGIGDFAEGTGAITTSGGKVSRLVSAPEMNTAPRTVARAAAPAAPGPQDILQQAQGLLGSSNADHRVMGAKLMRHAYPQMLAAESQRYGADQTAAAHRYGADQTLEGHRMSADAHRYGADRTFEGHRMTAEAQRGLVGVEQARKDDELRMRSQEAYRKSLEPQFMREDKDGKPVVDTDALGEFERLAASTVAARHKEAQGADKKRWSSNFDGKARSVAELDDADKSEMLKNFRMRALHMQGAGGLPWDNTRGDSTDLMDWTPTVRGDQLEFDRLTARNKDGKVVGGNVKNYKYGKPIGYFDSQYGKTPTNEFLPTKAR